MPVPLAALWPHPYAASHASAVNISLTVSFGAAALSGGAIWRFGREEGQKRTAGAGAAGGSLAHPGGRRAMGGRAGNWGATPARPVNVRGRVRGADKNECRERPGLCPLACNHTVVTVADRRRYQALLLRAGVVCVDGDAALEKIAARRQRLDVERIEFQRGDDVFRGAPIIEERHFRPRAGDIGDGT